MRDRLAAETLPDETLPDETLPDETLPDETLHDERALLDHARRCLEAMRRRTASLKADAADEWSEEALRWHLGRRMADLSDDGATALFFGRLDFDTPVELDTDRLYVGRRHIRDAEGNPIVIDWRALVARPFYRATPTSRQGVRLRRRFGFKAGALTSIQDEPLDLLDEAESQAAADRVLRAEIERPRIGPMRDIVVTIQPEQDDLIRAPFAETICIQGGPGTGKTAVGLHRAAFLLYEHRERLRRDGVLMVGPSTAYLAFIREVLPGLGETRVVQQTLEQLSASVTVRGQDSAEVATVKGDARMAEVIRRAAFLHVQQPTEPLVLPYGQRRLRVGPPRLTARIDELRADGVRYETGRTHLREWVVERCLRELEHTDGLTAFDSPRQVERKLGATAELRAFLNRTWPRLEPARLVHKLLTMPEFLAAAAGGLLDETEQAQVLWSRKPRSVKAAPWSLADAFLVDEAADVIGGTRTYGHVVADEAQDLSPMQLRAIGRRCRFGSATLLGDLAQGTAPWSVPRWEDALGHLGRARASIQHLPRAFRSPGEVLDFANRLLPEIAPDVAAAASVRSVPGALRLHPTGAAALDDAWVAAVEASLAEDGSVGLIAADARLPALSTELERRGIPFRQVDRFDLSERLSLVPASAVKGLEFDQVVLVEPADLAAAGTRGLRQLYIALTRAVLHLHVVHSQPLPELLAAA